MSSLGLDVLDYSTGTRLELPLGRDLWVVIPKRPGTLPPLEERPDSSVRLRERRLYFQAVRTPSRVVLVPEVPAGTYAARVRATHYLPLDLVVTAPQFEPLTVTMHRSASYPFGSEDTLVRGLVRKASGAVHTGFDVRVTSVSEPLAPVHSVPLDANGEFVAFLPEKRSTGAVKLDAFHTTGLVSITLPAVTLHRSNLAPVITVP